MALKLFLSYRNYGMTYGKINEKNCLYYNSTNLCFRISIFKRIEVLRFTIHNLTLLQFPTWSNFQNIRENHAMLNELMSHSWLRKTFRAHLVKKMNPSLRGFPRNPSANGTKHQMWGSSSITKRSLGDSRGCRGYRDRTSGRNPARSFQTCRNWGYHTPNNVKILLLWNHRNHFKQASS